MAAWYNGKEFKVYDISQYDNDSDRMLQDFWFVGVGLGNLAPYLTNDLTYITILNHRPIC
jgi:hypothetical protein